MSTKALGIAFVLCVVPTGAGAQSYVGANRCRECHEVEYQIWSAGPHARSHESLSLQQRQDAKCSHCHTTANAPDAPVSELRGVHCERCHGSGRYYQHAYVMKDRELARAVGLVMPTSEHCQQCHTEGTPSIEPFDFDLLWLRISHGKEAKKAASRASALAVGTPPPPLPPLPKSR